MRVLLVAVAGAGVGLGLWFLLAGARGVPVLPRPSSAGPRVGVAAARVALAAVAAAVVYLLTGWPVAAVAGAGLAAAAPSMRGAAGQRRTRIARTEAVASWIEMVRDNISGAAGLEEALATAATPDVAPPAIAAELRRFGHRLERSNLVDALAVLAEDLDEPSADLAIVALTNASRMEARDLGPLLSRLAVSIREDVSRREQIDAGRQRIRTSARIVVGVTLGVSVILALFGQGILEPYDTFFGQVWLLVVFAVFAVGGVLIHQLGKFSEPERFRARRGVGVSR